MRPYDQGPLDAGYANVLVLPPFYYKDPGEEGLYAYYSRVIETVGSDDLRLYLYHFPKMSAVPLPVALVTRLRAAFGPVVAGLKDSTGDIEQTRAFIEASGGVAEGFDVYPANEALLWDGLKIGSAGTISGSTNAFAALSKAALNAPDNDARETAMVRVKAARAFAAQFNMMAAMKQIEAWRSGDDNWLRLMPPLTALSGEERERLRAGLKGF